MDNGHDVITLCSGELETVHFPLCLIVTSSLIALELGESDILPLKRNENACNYVLF